MTGLGAWMIVPVDGIIFTEMIAKDDAEPVGGMGEIGEDDVDRLREADAGDGQVADQLM